MRLPILLLTTLLASTALAGCFGDGDDGDDHDCPSDHDDEHCPDPTTTTGPGGGGNTTTEPPVPNEPPVLELATFNADGNETNVVLRGESLTFDASGSTDPDGQITDMAVIVIDSNQTRSAQLIQDAQPTTATFTFDRPGLVRVVLNALDDAGDQTTLQSEVYVNHPQELVRHTFSAAAPAAIEPDCSNEQANALLDSAFYRTHSFEVREGAQWVEAWIEVLSDSGEVEFAICDTEETRISPIGATGDTISTDEGVAFNASLDYQVAVVSHFPQSNIRPHVIVHYEPREAGEGDEEEA